ncbi:MAG: hypothetical protein ACYS5V_03945 [Planctomycetota bacterium]|jgi:hypothetical protein
MQNHERLTPGERELERTLAACNPSATCIDRDRLLYQAGRAAGRRHRWIWQGAAAAATVVLAVSLAVRPEPREIERIVLVPVESPGAVSVADLDPEAARDRWAEHARYAAVRNELLAGELEALPALPHAVGATRRPPTLHDLLGTRPPEPPASPLARLGTILFGGKS